MSENTNENVQNNEVQEESVTLEDLEALRKALSSERSLKKSLEKELKALQEESSESAKSFDNEIEKLKSKIESLESEKKDMEVTNLKTNKIIEHGLPMESMDFITGTTEEEILSQIEKFKSLVGADNSGNREDKKPEPNHVFGDKSVSSITTKSLLGNFIRESI